MAWAQLIIASQSQYSETLSDLLQEYGALSVSIEDAGEQPLFQVTVQAQPLWSAVKISALFTEETDLEFVMHQIKQDANPAILSYHSSTLAEQDWVRKTQQNFPPQCFAQRLWVIPSWCDTKHYQSPVVRIDPGLAFGTGTHATTRLCLQWLAENPPENLQVMDYGCGSGILALTALACGASKVLAIDHDPQALEATENNAALNGFDNERLEINPTTAIIHKPSDLIIANILTQPLVTLVETFYQYLNNNGKLVLSGILETEIPTIAEAYGKYFTLCSAESQGEWVRLLLIKDTATVK